MNGTGAAVTDTADPGAHRQLGRARLVHPGRATERTGGYKAMQKALAMPPDDVIATVKDSGLRGRGGAGFPTGVKWSFIPQGDGKPHYLAVNADESEPGTCKDIPLMMANPHVLIEGIIITCYAIRASHAFIYVRGEVLHVIRRLQLAVAEAYEAGYLGEDILGTGFDLDVVVHAGAGAYICGEETALLDSLEGYRGLPRNRPPFPAVEGLYACPTVINNVESIASVPSIINNGAGLVRRPRHREVEGLRHLLAVRAREDPGPVRGAARHHAARADRPGGRHAAAGAPAEVLDAGRVVHATADPRAPGRPAGLRGRGRRRVDARAPGRCRSSTTPPACCAPRCAGRSSTSTSRAASARRAARARTGWCGRSSGMEDGNGTEEDLDKLNDIGGNIIGRAFCALGDAAPAPIMSAIQYFRDEIIAHQKNGGCWFDPAASTAWAVGRGTK